MFGVCFLGGYLFFFLEAFASARPVGRSWNNVKHVLTSGKLLGIFPSCFVLFLEAFNSRFENSHRVSYWHCMLRACESVQAK